MNILLLTSVYPSPDDKNENVTKVVQYFAREWSRQGHCVKVVHNVHRYPFFVHIVPHSIKKYLATKLSFYIPDLKNVSKRDFFDKDIQVFRRPVFKLIPHAGHSNGVLRRQANRICRELEKMSFTPDIIMGHWMSPQIQLISLLKKVYNCRTSLVLHGREYLDGKKFNCHSFLSDVDRLGCRSRTEAEYVKDVLGLKELPFVCFSGVPDSFINGKEFDVKKFESKPDVWELTFVGRLVAYKQIDKVLVALSKLKNQNFVFNIIGEGPEETSLKESAEKLGLKDKVIFHGRLDRSCVLDYLSKSHIFVMISLDEVFGLVYLEAMATSCITIGSRNGGIDGVIIDGENGILCPQGDSEALLEILDRIFNSDVSYLKYLSENGFKTAVNFTDSCVAEKYLDDVTKIQ